MDLVVPAMVGAADARSHRGDPPVFAAQPRSQPLVLLRLAQNRQRARDEGRDTGLASLKSPLRMDSLGDVPTGAAHLSSILRAP